MPGNKTNAELNLSHRKNTLKQPQSGYNVLCGAAKDLHNDLYYDASFHDVEALFHASTFTNGLNGRFADQGDLRENMRLMIYELNKESNEAEEEIQSYFDIESGSIEEEKGSVEDKYGEIKNYYTAIRNAADEYISKHPASEFGAHGIAIKQGRVDTVKGMRDYADAMLYNIDLKLRMRRDEEIVRGKLDDLKKHPENLSNTLDEIMDIESAYPPESRMHGAIEQLCRKNLIIDRNADPDDLYKYRTIGDPIRIYKDLVTDEYTPNVYTLGSDSAQYESDIQTLYSDLQQVDNDLVTLKSGPVTTEYNVTASEEALSKIEENFTTAENVGVAIARFENALRIESGSVLTAGKHNILNHLTNMYSAARQLSYGKEFAQVIDERLKSDTRLYDGIVCRGSIAALRSTARAMGNAGVTEGLAADFTDMFLETLEKGEAFLTSEMSQSKTTKASDRISELYCVGAKLLGDQFKDRVDQAIENNKWAGKLMNYMASDMSRPVFPSDQRESYKVRMQMSFELFSKHNPGKALSDSLISSYNKLGAKLDGVEETVTSGKNPFLKEGLFKNIETHSLGSASFDTEETRLEAEPTRSLKSGMTTRYYSKAEGISDLEKIKNNIASSENIGVARVRFNNAARIAMGGIDAGYKTDMMNQMRDIYAAARQTEFGKAFADDVEQRFKSDPTMYYNTVFRGGMNALDQIAKAMKKSGPTPMQAKIFTETFLETLERGNDSLLAAASSQSRTRLSDDISKLYHTGATLLGDDFKKAVDNAVENTKWGKDLMTYVAGDMYTPLRYSKFDKDAEYGDRMKTAFELLLKHDPDRKTSDMLLDAYAAQDNVIDGLEKFVVNDKSKELKEAMFNRLGNELNAFKKAESAEAAMASYNKLQQMNLRTDIFARIQGVIENAYGAAVEKFGEEITHYEDRTHMQDEVNDDYLQEFREFSKEVKNAKSSFRNSTEYNLFSSTTEAYVSLVEEINRAKKAEENHININNLSSNAGKMARGILNSENISMEDAGRLMTRFSSAIMEAARNYEKYKMADHTLDPENEPNKKLLNKDDLRKLNLTHQVLGKAELPKDPKDLYKQNDAKDREQSIML